MYEETLAEFEALIEEKNNYGLSNSKQERLDDCEDYLARHV